MTKTEYEEALYTAKLIVSKRVADWAVSHHAIVELAKALVLTDEALALNMDKALKTAFPGPAKPKGGLAAIAGKWPGDETIEELELALNGMKQED